MIITTEAFNKLAVQAAMSCSVFQVSIYGWLSAMDHVGVSGTGESTPLLVVSVLHGWHFSTIDFPLQTRTATALSDYRIYRLETTVFGELQKLISSMSKSKISSLMLFV